MKCIHHQVASPMLYSQQQKCIAIRWMLESTHYMAEIKKYEGAYKL